MLVSLMCTYNYGIIISVRVMMMLLAPCENRQIRLVGGNSYGRVEVCGSGVWGTVCSDEYWDDIDAGVFCKQLGFSRYGSYV